MIFSGPFAKARQEVKGTRTVAWQIAACLAAVIIPALIVVAGLLTQLLGRGLDQSPVPIGRHLMVPLPTGLLDLPPVRQLAWLVALAAVLALALALLLWRTRLGLLRRGRSTVEAFHRRILQHSLVRAETEGASAQRPRVEAIVRRDLPALYTGLVAWWRIVPRAVLVLLGCVVLALLVDVWLACLALVSGIFVWRLYRWLSDDEDLRTVGWEREASQTRLVELVQQAPLLARLQSRAIVLSSFEEELQRMGRRQAKLDAHFAKLVPLVALAAMIAICVVVLALGVNRFSGPQSAGMPAAVVLGLALSGAAASALRILRSFGEFRAASEAAAVVYRFLNSHENEDLGERVGISGLRQAVELNNVTLAGDAGDEILSSLTLQLQPSSMVAVMGTDAVATSALVELLLGFGRPSRGTLTIDGIPITEIHPNSLAKQVFWVGQDGPIWRGTVRENVLGLESNGGEAAMQEALRRTGVYERLNDLSEGLSTMLAPDDQQLDSPTRYAIGVARALLRRPAVVVVQEPEPEPENALADDPRLDSLLFLAQNGSLVIMIPRRLRTLRAADRVILLNGSRLAGEGKHEELLAGSDLYRHLNYLLFNPYRNK